MRILRNKHGIRARDLDYSLILLLIFTFTMAFYVAWGLVECIPDKICLDALRAWVPWA